MNIRRRAAAPRLIEWTGERCVPWAPDVQVVYEHFHRYLWASRLVRDQRVLDLGCGEGFGSAILAETADRVTAVDVDATTVEHARLNYSSPNLEFLQGSALDLSLHDASQFDVVVAFEIVEHVADQQRLIQEVARVLSDRGLLVISTPDRRMYTDVEGRQNPFHARELTHDELRGLLQPHFPKIAMWGQRTVTGSHMLSLGAECKAVDDAGLDFFLARSGDEWHVAGPPADTYLVALATKHVLPRVASGSTLADCSLQLMRDKEREAVLAAADRDAATRHSAEVLQTLERERIEHERTLERQRIEHERTLEREHTNQGRELQRCSSRMQAELRQRDIDIDRLQNDLGEAQHANLQTGRELNAVAAELGAARQLNRRTEESVTWRAFLRTRSRLYAAIGETSLSARALRLGLRTVGGLALKRSEVDAVHTSRLSDASQLGSSHAIALPEYDDPSVSLVIPLHARADLTLACLRSIRQHTTGVSYEVILVDDRSDSETQRLLSGIAGATIVRNDHNIGYLRSVNRGTSRARGRWLVLCNNDIEVTRGWLKALLVIGESSDDVAVVAPKFVYPDGRLNEAGGIIWSDGTGVNYGRGETADSFRYEYSREVDYGSAAALMVRSAFWRERGGYDERYVPMYYEDTDLCFAARERGLKVIYQPEAVVVHVEGATAGTDASFGHKRHQDLNRAKFVARWHDRLQSQQLRPSEHNLWRAANRHRGHHVLVIDHQVPKWDQDSGSLRMLGMLQALLGLGARVTFLPDNFAPVQPYTRNLQRLGVEVIYGAVDIDAELARFGPTLTAAILSRPQVAARWLDRLREYAPSATVAYDTVDLHWLREARRSAVGSGFDIDRVRADGGLASLAPRAQALRHLELAMIRATDVAFVVSESELLQVRQDVPHANIVVVPNVHDIELHVPSIDDRAGIIFIGGFAHLPNVDAAVRLVREVMPLVWRQLDDVRVLIVGAGAPHEVLALESAL
ncbi:MAG: methyltransferase domain-containing protein, partial [Solirubrobacteraceae bacterium]